MSRERLAQLAASREAAHLPSDTPPKALKVDARATVLLEYQSALHNARELLTALVNTEPGTERAAELADKLAQHVQVVTCDAQYLACSKDGGE